MNRYRGRLPDGPLKPEVTVDRDWTRGAPGVREQYNSDADGSYYAAFLLDHHGNTVEAVVREF